MDMPTIGMTVGEFRAAGGIVEADVPDCAVFICSGYEAKAQMAGTVISLRVVAKEPRWEWVTASMSIGPPSEEG